MDTGGVGREVVDSTPKNALSSILLTKNSTQSTTTYYLGLGLGNNMLALSPEHKYLGVVLTHDLKMEYAHSPDL